MSLYDKLSELQGSDPWGSLLDAGTGKGSMRWLLSLTTDRWTAVTGSSRMAEVARAEIAERQRPQDRLIVGNWMDAELLSGESYDTVLADYLLGAMDAFAPYWQDNLFARLKPLVGRRLYVIGLEPYVAFVSSDPAGRIVGDIGRVRDACLLLSNDRPYREYPLDWVLRSLRASGLRIVDTQRFPIRYGERFINSQLDLCSESLQRMRDRALAVALQSHIADLRSRALAMAANEGGLRHGYDYIVVAER